LTQHYRIARHDAVLFDFDGVLVDSRQPFARSVNAALAEHGLSERPEAELYKYLGPPLHETFRSLVGDRAPIQACVDSYRERYGRLSGSETTVFPGIRGMLEPLHRETPLVIATSKPQALAEPLAEALDLSRFFVAVVGPSLASEDEQKTVTVGRSLQALSPDARPVMVGDRSHDIVAAHANDLPAIGVLWGIGTRDELLGAGADALAGSPAELAAMLVRS
jgi:phosphoglycolate phosphatase